ncbi:hypothetical protein L0C25_02365 [Solicola gregarius]|uniref:Transcriptional regulator SbtR-like C-terminal domain-containing protein n=1 Tax=Solicola gregarius TaxID=2908642 RepID=A0AA46YMP9_9ACTN|nr:hypothetical protein [Solicola gregarius]UYM05938.1 hypothetical protein L0C25_02365 [Solicola gregarius]
MAGAEAHELSHRLGGSAGEIERAVAEPVADLDRELGHLLRAAKDAGAVSPELDQAALAAVIAAAHAAYTHRSGGVAAMAIVFDGLFGAPD